MGRPLRILIVEDSEDDTLLMVHELKRGGYKPVFERVESPEAMISALNREAPDLIIADYTMPHFSGRAALNLYRERNMEIPFILVSGTIGDDVGVEAMIAGAHDYICKSNLARLVPAISRELREAETRIARKAADQALRKAHEELERRVNERTAELAQANRALKAEIEERRHAENALQESEEKFRLLFEKSSDPILLLDGVVFIDCNEAALKLLRCAKEQLIGLRPFDLAPKRQPDGRLSSEKARELIDVALKEGVNRFEWVRRTLDGEDLWIDTSLTVIPIRGKQIMYTVCRDITERKRAEEDLRATHQRLFDIIEFLPDATFVIDKEKKVVAWNRACEEMTGVGKEGIIGKGDFAYAVPFYGVRRPLLIDYVTMDSDELSQEYQSIRRNGDRLYGEAFVPAAYNGRGAFLAGHAAPLFDKKGNMVGAIESLFDKTGFKHLESQLRQAQKMEAIGTLTGGIAHDFNNILTALLGYAGLLKTKTNDPTTLIYVDHVLSASQKARDLVRSLSGFSRRQAMDLKPINIHGVIRGTKKLLKQLLTEDILVKTHLYPEDITIMADATQIDQILFNLAANAGDAMPRGGVFTIETKTLELDEKFKHFHGYGEPGRYVLLSISDTGTGMDGPTTEKIFDPFFTTKEAGKGTGLGLSTVYGIVKQHNGYVTVYSEPGRGTTFHIYLPVVSDKVTEAKSTTAPVQRGNETILVAEDNEAVRGLIRDVLSRYGYTIIEATNGAEAIERFKATDKIDILILDSVMPIKNGREAYDAISSIRPSIKVLFTSGYTRDVILDKGIEDRKFHFISKPILPNDLLLKVREVLDEGPFPGSRRIRPLPGTG